MRLLVLNLATDVDDPIHGFSTRWIQALATRMECVDVVAIKTGCRSRGVCAATRLNDIQLEP